MAFKEFFDKYLEMVFSGDKGILPGYADSFIHQGILRNHLSQVFKSKSHAGGWDFA
jgi:hypothetical protein